MRRQHARVITSSWAGAAALSLALAASLFPYALFVDAASAGLTALYGAIGLLVIQAAICVVWWRRWQRIPLRFLGIALLAVAIGHLAMGSQAWADLAPEQWRLWIAPVPMMIAAAIQLVLAGVPSAEVEPD
jgi:hypothetical protein